MSNRSPRLQFSDEESAAPELKKAIRKADRAVDKLENAEAKIPKKSVTTKERVVDPKSGKVTTRLYFEEINKKKPQSKLSHTFRDIPGSAVLSQVHREIRESEQDNVGVESAHRLVETAETSCRVGRSAYRSHRLKPYRNAERAESKADRAKLSALNKESARQNPQLTSNPYSRWQQKRAIKKEYAAAKAGKGAHNTGKASEVTAKAAKKAVEETKKAGEFFARHKKGFLIVGGIALVVMMFLNIVSSCSVLFQGGMSGVAISTYPSEDADMLAAEAQYAGMEADLKYKLDNYETLYPNYDEYHYELDEIGHDPYVLISMLTAMQGGQWTIDDVQGGLAMLFEKQYQLTQVVATQTSGDTEYTVCTVTLHNENLSHLPVFIMSEDKVGLYSMYMSTLGNRPDLFPASAYPHASTKKEYTNYAIPPEALKDEQFAAMMKEAEKYLGYPYVWGGSNPTTSFDCSGFVSWVINHSGWNVGRLGAQGLYNICTPVSASDAKPGDLVFFEHTYNTTGVSHVGIYVGNGMMIAAGDPISYTSIETSYWQSHFYSFGRLPAK